MQKAIASSRLKQSEAAKVLRVTQPCVSDLLRGRIDLFSTDALIDMLARLGVGVRLVVGRVGAGGSRDEARCDAVIQRVRQVQRAASVKVLIE